MTGPPARLRRPRLGPRELAVLTIGAGVVLLLGDRLSNGPLILLGLVGLVLAIGGAVAAAERHRASGENGPDPAAGRLRVLALVSLPTAVVVIGLAQAPSGWPRSLILSGFCVVWLPLAALLATRRGA